MSSTGHHSEHPITFLRELNLSRDIETLAKLVLEHTIALVPGAQRGSFILLNRETDSYEYRATLGWPLEELRHVPIPASQVLQRVVYEDRPAIIREPYQQDREKLSEELAGTLETFGPNRAILTLPIPYEGEVIAYLNLDNVDDPDAFCEEDFELLASVQEEIALAVQVVLQRERLEELERFFRTLFEKLADAVYLAEFDGTILVANPAACRQSGYSREELIGMNIMGDLAQEEPAVTYESAIDELGRGKVVRFEEVMRRKDGSLYVTDCHVSAIEYQGRQVTLSVNRDVTDVAALQKKLFAAEEAARRMKLIETKEELYDQLLEATREIFGYSACGIAETDGKELRVVKRREAGPILGERLALDGPGITVAACNAGQSVYVQDVSLDDRYVEGVPGTRSELVVPFWVGSTKAGVFDVQSAEVDGIPPEDRNLLEILTGHMAVALAGLERLDEVRSLSRKLELLHHSVDEMQRCSSVEELCQTAVRTASEVLGISECNVGLAEGEWLVPVASTQGVERLGRPMRRGEGVSGKSWETGQTMWGNVSDFPFARPARQDFKSVISVPISQEGVFQAISRLEDAFTSSDAFLAEILAGHLRGEIKRLRLEAELRNQATRDALTGLYNRRFLNEVLDREVARAKRYGHPISVIMADIDQFKQVNDRFGHLKGDQVLREIAALLQEHTRDSDFVFRYGGEEFVLLLPETETQGGEVIKRLQEAIHRWAGSAGLGDLEFGLTMGSTIWDPRAEPEVIPETLLHRADEVLYGFKRWKRR